MSDGQVPTAAPLTERAYRMIRGMILHQQLRPGERTSVADLAAATGLGREPVKSAMTRLTLEKLLVMRGRSGTRVAKLDPHQIGQLFEMRRLYETSAAPLIADRITSEQVEAVAELLPGLSTLSNQARDRSVIDSVVDFIDLDVNFHARVITGANNPYLLDGYLSLNLHLLISQYLVLDRGFHSEQRQSEHTAIVDAIRRRDPDAIAAALIGHANTTEKIIMATITSSVMPLTHK